MLIQQTTTMLAETITVPVATRARDVMTAAPLTIPERATAYDALKVMRAEDVRHLPVVNDDGKVVGMLSDRDLAQLPLPALAGEGPLDPDRSPVNVEVRALMCRDVVVVELDTPLATVVDALVSQRIGAVPVVEEGGKPVGIVSSIDLLRQLRRLL